MAQDFDRVPTAYAEGWWKEALSKYLPRFFEFYFPEVFEDVDWRRKPRFLDKELQAIAPARSDNPRGGRRVVDTLLDLRRQTGERSLVLVHIEVQAQKVSDFEKRMLLYHTRLFERHDKEVCSLAILADKSRTWRPESYEHGLWGTNLSFRFPVCKLLDFRDRLVDLEASDNPFALLTAATLHAQATKENSQEREAAKWRMARGLYRVGLSKQEIRDFFKLIDWVLRLTPKQESLFWKRLEKLEKENKMPYITSVERIGIEKGLKKGRREALLDILEARFGELPKTVSKKIAELSDLDRLRELSRLAATVENLKGFEGEL